MLKFVTALRQQDWTTVIIEVLIVVAGIFIGLQVSSWNESRIDALRGAELSQRLAEEITEEAVNYTDITRYQLSAQRNVAYLLKAVERSNLDRDHGSLLVAAYRASQLQWYASVRGTFDEIVASGELGLIDTNLMRIANRYYNIRWVDRVFEEEQNSAYRAHFRRSLDHNLQSRIAAECGDKIIDETDRLRIDYECSLSSVSSVDIDAINAFLEDPKTIELLRQRFANLDTYIANYDYNYRFYGLDQFAPQGEVIALPKNKYIGEQ